MNVYDIAIIGSGPGGYVSAIRSAQLGFKTALIEKYPVLGGTCLNVGCIPSKTLLDSSKKYFDVQKNFSSHGITINEFFFNFEQFINRKKQVIDQIHNGVKYLMDKNKIDIYYGIAKFKDINHITIINKENNIEEIKFRYAIIATGSKPSDLPYLKIDKKQIISSTEALSLIKIPKHLIIIGGGVIGLEIGSIYNRIGSKVTIIEYCDRLIPTMDYSLGKELEKILKKSGIKFYFSTQVIESILEDSNVIINAKNENHQNLQIKGDYCLLAIGRNPFTNGLDLSNIGINTDNKGFILVNKYLQTYIKNIYAIGDVIGGPMLAHKAEDEGIYVVESISGQKPYINYNLIPSIIYTYPEIASVGKTENQLKEKNISYKIGQFPMRALGRSYSTGETDGFVKILADKNTDEILGVHIVGSRASDMIMEAVIAMEFRASAEDITRICHPHPTFTEAIKEAALSATDNRPLHI